MASKGANKAKCQAYKSASTRERNKRRRLTKHLKTNENDISAQKAFKEVV
jgi:hypothetical protein